MTSSSTPNTPTLRLADVAAQAKSDRNRAVDFYRAVAMIAVAIGHWCAMAFVRDADGSIVGRNALELAPQMSWITWLLQVMPLFFVVGGFSSAMSLDSHLAAGRPGAAWVADRLRRMCAPALVLAATWLAVLGIGAMTPVRSLVFGAAAAAAIPLWFLSNYTIDTAIAPLVRPLFKRRPVAVGCGAVALFLLFEFAHYHHVPVVGHLNWVLGWLLFQLLGFAWKDGLLGSARRVATLAVVGWVVAYATVKLGPWPQSMIHIPGMAHSPTHPPSIALVLFGLAYSLTAIALSGPIDRWLAASRRAWTLVVAANGRAMSVYLWHMSAGVLAAGLFNIVGLLPEAPVGSGAWWLEKLPMMLLAAVLLALIVKVVGGHESRSLFAPKAGWDAGPVAITVVAALLSAAIKGWAGGDLALIVGGTAVVLAVGHGVLRCGAGATRWNLAAFRTQRASEVA